MSPKAQDQELQDVPVEKIDKNPENPRIVFRSGELAELEESIRSHGVLVPIAVYKEGKRYIIIDGERRWKCALKLNLETIPALVQPKPTLLNNLLLMFNIHATREDWDLLTIAMKLPEIIRMLREEKGSEPTEGELSEATGLKRAVVRRARLLMRLPDKYKKQILEELEKPKGKQKITEDLFIELEKALTTAERSMGELVEDRDSVRQVLLTKFKDGTINNRVLFRKVGKIARAEKVGADKQTAARELAKVFSPNNYKIETAYDNSVAAAYAERDLDIRIDSLMSVLDGLDLDDLDGGTITKLSSLKDKIDDLLEGQK